jgi:hypothetical protein
VTEDTARTVANVVLVTAGAAVAYVVMTKPPLRRMAFRALRIWLGASVPVYLMTEARDAWVESAARPSAAPDIMAR